MMFTPPTRGWDWTLFFLIHEYLLINEVYLSLFLFFEHAGDFVDLFNLILIIFQIGLRTYWQEFVPWCTRAQDYILTDQSHVNHAQVAWYVLL